MTICVWIVHSLHREHLWGVDGPQSYEEDVRVWRAGKQKQQQTISVIYTMPTLVPGTRHSAIKMCKESNSDSFWF